MDAVLDEAVAALGVDADEVISGGYRVYTGLDPAMQARRRRCLPDADRFPAAAADGTPVQAALVALDTGSGAIRAVVGGRRYDVALGLNHATQIRRQPGSAFKPMSTYAAAIDAYGFVPSSTVEDTPRTFDGRLHPRQRRRRDLRQGDAAGGAVPVAEHRHGGAGGQHRHARPARLCPALRHALSDQDVNLSLALGSLTDGVSPAELGAAYCALANGGMRVTPHFIRSIEDADGPRGVSRPGRGRAGRAARHRLYAHRHAQDRRPLRQRPGPEAKRACPWRARPAPWPTTRGGTRDIWTVAYTPELAVSVWMGYDSPDDEHSLPASEGGSGYPARLCAAFLGALPANQRHGFQKPLRRQDRAGGRAGAGRGAPALLSTGTHPRGLHAAGAVPAGTCPRLSPRTGPRPPWRTSGC